MAAKSVIKIVSKQSPEFNSNITVDGLSYHVQTEDMGAKTCKIISRIYLKGEVVFSRSSDYSHIAKLEDHGDRLKAMMDNHHRTTAEMFTRERSKAFKTKSEYFENAKQLLRKGSGKSALKILREGLDLFPSDPFLMSYYGYLVASVENNPDEGIKICERAVSVLGKSMLFGSEFFYPIFYLNLGRAYLKGGNKAGAVEAFQKGLKSDPENHDLQWEIRKLGVRKGPPLPFLKRNNPINKYIGMLRKKMTEK